MSYGIELSPQANEDLAALPTPVQAGVIRQLDRLAASPSQMNTKASTGLYTEGQLWRTQFRQGTLECFLEVVFRYTQDELNLYIVRIHVEFD